jgi:hypothetical protein
MGLLSSKILKVLEAVATFGPATLDQITAKLPYTRSSVYRALILIENEGWIRRSLNGRNFLLTDKMEDISNRSAYQPAGIVDLVNMLESMRKETRLTLSIVTQIKANVFCVVDSTDFPLILENVPPETEKLLGIIATLIAKLGLASVPHRKPREQESSNTQRIADSLVSHGYFVADDLLLGVVPFVDPSGETFLIVCEDKEFTNDRVEDIHEFSQMIYQQLNSVRGSGPSTERVNDFETVPSVPISVRQLTG